MMWPNGPGLLTGYQVDLGKLPELSMAFSVQPVVLGMSVGLLGVSAGQQVGPGVLARLTLALVVLPVGPGMCPSCLWPSR